MSMQYAAGLLGQYNKNKRAGTRVTEDDKPGLIKGTWSYANPYDAIYNEYSGDKNFNQNMWRDAMALGEQDQYIAFLAQNKGRELDARFYNPLYYDYETMMLEMYLPLANTENVDEMRTTSVYDPAKDVWIEQDVGKMSDQAWLRYQLDESYTNKEKEITRIVEQWRKDQMSWLGQLGHSAWATALELGEGTLGALASLVDAVNASTVITPWTVIGDISQGKDPFERYLDVFASGLGAQEKKYVRTALDEYERTHTFFRDIDGNITGAGTYVAGIANSLGMMVPSMVANLATGGAAGVGQAVFYTSIFGSNMYDVSTNPYLKDTPTGIRIAHAAIRTGLEAGIEHLLGKIGGPTIDNMVKGLISPVNGAQIAQIFANFSGTAGAKFIAKSALQEGMEEFLQDFSTGLLDAAMGLIDEGYAKSNEHTGGITMQTLIDSFICGVLSSLVLSGGEIARRGTVSWAVNRSAMTKAKAEAEKAGREFDEKSFIGPADVVIEGEDGELQKLRGANKLYFSTILSEFSAAVESLRTDGIKNADDVKLAQEIYAAFSTLSQFYSSFDQERIKNCEMLLDRVVKAERRQLENPDQNVSLQSVVTFADEVVDAFRKMVGPDSIMFRRAEKKLREAAEKHKEELKESNTGEILGGVIDDEQFTKDPTITELSEQLKPKAVERLKQLTEDEEYSSIFITDGTVAIDEKDLLFVPEKWLENYTTGEIYQFLATTQVLDTLKGLDNLKEWRERLLSFYKGWTQKDDVTIDDAIQNFLFNENAYQAFLLSNGAENLFDFQNFILRIHTILKDVAGKAIKNGPKKGSVRRSAMLKQIYTEICKVWRMPTLKAVLNWGFELQLIGAEDVLLPKDIELINQYKKKREVMNAALTPGGITNAYANKKEDIFRAAKAFGIADDALIAVVEDGLNPDLSASDDKRVQSVLILDVLDYLCQDAHSSAEKLFTVPMGCIDFAKHGDVSKSQFVADAYLTFAKTYGISVRDVLRGRSPHIASAEYTKYMETLQKYNSPLAFVMHEMEMLLGDEFVVTPDTRTLGTEIKISYKIPAEMFFFDKNFLSSSSEFKRNVTLDSFCSNLLFYLDPQDLMAVQNRIDDIRSDKIAHDRWCRVFGVQDLMELFPFSIEDTYTEMLRKYFDTGRFILPNGVEISANDANFLFLDMFTPSSRAGIKISDIMDLDILSSDMQNYLEQYEVFMMTSDEMIATFGKTFEGVQGFQDAVNKSIVICTDALDIIDTMVHEVNHAIQTYGNIPGGSNSFRTKLNEELLLDVWKRCPIYVNLLVRWHRGIGLSSNEVRELEAGSIPAYLLSSFADAAYRAMGGELFSRAYAHNLPAKGYSIVNDGNFTRVISPDGSVSMPFIEQQGQSPEAWPNKSLADISFDRNLNSEPVEPKMTSTLVQAALIRSIKNVLEAQQNPTSDNYRKTYHSTFTGNSASAMRIVTDLLNPNLPFFMQLTANVDYAIRNPKDMLSPELLQEIGENVSEGNVYYRVREYIEKHHPGVSVDRLKGGQYVLVDDNSFEDFYSASVKRLDMGETSLYEKYGDGREVPLDKFYEAEELYTKLGLSPNIKVIIRSDVENEFVIDKKHPYGVIYITANPFTTNRTIMLKMNHEFRHVLQHYCGFEGGSTTAFEVSDEMLADVEEHLPMLFDEKDVVDYAKKRAKTRGTSWKKEVVRIFVYNLTGGELNANGVAAELLSMKPTVMSYEAGKPVIYMSWYDANTGVGRHKTDRIANRAENIEAPVTSEPVKKKAKGYYFSNEKAKGTLLERFIKEGKQNQLHPLLQDFVIGVTNHVDILPPELLERILDGTLNMQAFRRWFRGVKTINDDLFELINKYIFKNDSINTTEELFSLAERDPAFYWAAGVVLREKGIKLSEFMSQQDIASFNDFLDKVENSKLVSRIQEKMSDFLKVKVTYPNGSTAITEIDFDEQANNYMRIYIMENFDGTLASVYKIAKRYRTLLTGFFQDRVNMTSLEQGVGESGESTIGDFISVDDVDETSAGYGNDIIAMYEEKRINREVELETLVREKYRYDVAKYVAEKEISPSAKKRQLALLTDLSKLSELIRVLEDQIDKTEEDVKRLKYYQSLRKQGRMIRKQMADFKAGLEQLTPEELHARHELLDIALDTDGKIPESIFDLSVTHYQGNQMTKEGQEELSRAGLRKDRIAVVGRIKGKAKTLLGYVRDGKISFNQLPKEAQELFELVSVTDSATQRKISEYKLKREYVTVGRGKKKLDRAKSKSTGVLLYAPAHDISEGSEVYRHSVEHLLEVDELLFKLNAEIREMLKSRDAAVKKAERKARELEIENRELKEKIEYFNTQFTLTPKNRTRKTRTPIDSPAEFTVASEKEMPEILKQILTTSFDEMAYTKVQFASRDMNDTLYDKEALREKGLDPDSFESRRMHEISNWEDFYEANRALLISLSRKEVFEILDWIKSAHFTVSGPANKLRAFEIFLLGFFVDAARSGHNNWNFSATETASLESLFERKASEAGSALNAVSQMRSVINPLKVIRSAMFDEWKTITNADKDALIKAVDDLQRETDTEKRTEKSKQLLEKLNAVQKKELEAIVKEKPWTKEWFAKIWESLKTWRYIAMLSSPATWIRNTISNVVTFVLNKTADAVAGLVFSKKAYRNDQWDLRGVQISEEVRKFIDENFNNNPLFESLYSTSNKYDLRQTKNIEKQRHMFISMLVKSVEARYAANKKFSAPVLQAWQEFISNRMSDASFVKAAANQYFGKILTLEIQAGHIQMPKTLDGAALQLFTDAVIMANEDYMHKRSFAADLIDGVKEKHPVLHEALTVMFPFINSSTNWLEEIIKFTPIGMAQSIIRMARLEKEIERLEARRAKGELVKDSRAAEYYARRDIGKGIIGMLFSVVGAILTAIGFMRLDEEDDKFYMTIGDVKVDITGIYGTASVFIGANVVQAWTETLDPSKDNFVTRLENMLGKVSEVIFEEFFFSQILERHKYDGNMYEILLTESDSFLRSFIPQMWQFFIKITKNEGVKYSSSFIGVFERWANSFVPFFTIGEKKINPYTGTVETEYALPIIGDLMASGIVGAKFFWYSIDEGERLAREYGVKKGMLTGELTVDKKKHRLDVVKLNTKYGELNKVSLEQIKSQEHYVEMPDGKYKTLHWDKLSDEQRTTVINRTMTQNADIAKIYVWTKSGHKYYASKQMYQKLRALGITKNVYLGDKDFVE